MYPGWYTPFVLRAGEKLGHTSGTATQPLSAQVSTCSVRHSALSRRRVRYGAAAVPRCTDSLPGRLRDLPPEVIARTILAPGQRTVTSPRLDQTRAIAANHGPEQGTKGTSGPAVRSHKGTSRHWRDRRFKPSTYPTMYDQYAGRQYIVRGGPNRKDDGAEGNIPVQTPCIQACIDAVRFGTAKSRGWMGRRVGGIWTATLPEWANGR
ncbi:hypothetical protein BV25DRAFT_1836582 [Artomyces pyxidatus]|uniref:Uncharacterized protein n=1 Tax=Artomyces pyxidatus TaxID=48021 RepID=A0ACB8T9U5_9AGAM|nr:hypothetical protein BV25DRAFT_1836582 [Artomyces pyxidatus]